MSKGKPLENIMPGRNSQITRIYAILQTLEGLRKGLIVGDLTTRLNDQGHTASRRTIYQDLEALQAAGFALSPSGDPGENNSSRWILESVTRINEHFVLSSRELLALYFAQGVLIPLKDTPFYGDLQSIFGKIEARLGTKGTAYFDELRSEIHFEPGPRWGLGIDPDVLETVRACCAERQVLDVVYATAGRQETRQRQLGPQFLYYAKGSLYLVAEDLENSEIKVFAIPRMSKASMADKAYDGTPADPEEFFQGSFGVFRGSKVLSVKLEVSPVLAPYIRERQWHESQRIVSKADGSLVLSLEVADTPELVQWILGLGAHAKVIEPAELRQSVLTAAKEIVGKYRPKAA